jgi:hypothetical protein
MDSLMQLLLANDVDGALAAANSGMQLEGGLGAFRLFLFIFLGIVGMGYCLAGRRREDRRLWWCGLALGIFPYFVHGTAFLVVIGLALAAFPFVRLRG